jgi:signal transduction histidine kinase
LFTRFAGGGEGRSSRAGLGLGLYICRGIVEEHGGTIWADSKPDQGTRFVVELPLAVGG